MAEIVLFHHAGGLTDGVRSLADTLTGAGHRVHTPDLFDGRTFADVPEGVAYAESVGEEIFARRAAEIVADMAPDVIYGGMSMGVARAAESVLSRPGSRGAFFLYGAVSPAWRGATWPADVPTQAHITIDDPWREPEAEASYRQDIPRSELFLYPGSGHLFAEPGHPDHEDDAAELAVARVLEFVSRSVRGGAGGS